MSKLRGRFFKKKQLNDDTLSSVKKNVISVNPEFPKLSNRGLKVFETTKYFLYTHQWLAEKIE